MKDKNNKKNNANEVKKSQEEPMGDSVITEDVDGKTEEINYEEKYKRALADYQNLLKQTARDKEDFLKYANEQILFDLLPVYDNLKTAMKHADDKADKSPWVVGVRYVIKQFSDVLKNHGVEEIEVVGKVFDHSYMEAVSGKGEKVAKELRPGYKLKGKVIIPAKVELENIDTN